MSAGALLVSMSAYAHDNFNEAYQSFDIDAIKADVKTLSSDKFAGREPSTAGETLTTNLLISQFKKLGLAPGNGNSYLQAVPMNSIVSEPVTHLKIADIAFEFPKNYVASSRQTREEINLNNSELVFVGYGITAPEYQWDDYKNVDVKGKNGCHFG